MADIMISISNSPPSLIHWQNLQQSRRLKTIRQIKWGVWLYFFLLIFEGSLRKWFLPGLATPLLIVRDPVAIYVLILAITRNIIRFNLYVISMTLITLLSVFTAILTGHGSWLVALFGARIFLLHFPLIFIIGQVFDTNDVIRVGKVIIGLALPMTILIIIQFYSPQSALVNRGIGGDVNGAGFSGAGNYFRPPATFSFINGTVSFYGLLACFIFYFWLNYKIINQLLLITATIALIISIPFSISRSLFYQVILSLLFFCFVVVQKPKYTKQIILVLVVGLVLFFAIRNLDFFQISIGAFTERFVSATDQEGGLSGTLIDRFLGDMINAISNTSDIPFFGYGLGMGTNVGSQLFTGRSTFLIAEGEWGRLTGELGLAMGIVVILIRLSFALKLTILCYRKLLLGNSLPLLLLSIGFLMIIQGQWSQPTSLGFSTLIGGLILASLRDSPNRQKTIGW